MLCRLSLCLLALAGIHCVAGAAMTTSGSSTYSSFYSSLARDGIWTELDYGANMYHSQDGGGETAPWFQLDMKRVHNVDSITIYNRAGDCKSRLFSGYGCNSYINAYMVFPAANEGANVGVSMSKCSGDVCPDFQLCGRITKVGTSVKYTVDCAEGVKGRYVILQLPGNNRMINLQELEFEGTPITGPYSEFLAQNYDSASNVWRDSSGNGLDAEAMVGDFSVVTEAGHGSTRNVTSVEGTTTSSIKFGQGSIPPEFSICALTRYSHEASQKRILTAVGTNWLLGHWGKNAGVAYFGGWKTWVSQSPTRFASTNWFVTCAQNNAYLTVNGYDQRTQNGGSGDYQMSINTYNEEKSLFGIAALRIYDYHLDTAAMQDMEADFRRIIGQAPQPCDTVEGGNVAEGTECALPFTYRGETYNECTSVNNGDTKWCSTDATFAGNWGECCNEQQLCTWSQINSQFAAGEADFQNGYGTLTEAQEACRLAPSVCQAVTCVPEGNWAYAGECFLRTNAVLTASAWQHQTYLPSPECSMAASQVDAGGASFGGSGWDGDDANGPSTPWSVTIDADDTVYQCGPDRYSQGCWKNVASDRTTWVHILHADMPATSGEHDLVHTVDSGAGTFTVSDAGIDYQSGEKELFFPFTCLCDN